VARVKGRSNRRLRARDADRDPASIARGTRPDDRREGEPADEEAATSPLEPADEGENPFSELFDRYAKNRPRRRRK